MLCALLDSEVSVLLVEGAAAGATSLAVQHL